MYSCTPLENFQNSFFVEHKRMAASVETPDYRCPNTSANISLFNTRNRCKICWKLTIKTSERRHWNCSGFVVVNFDYMPQLYLQYLSLLWTGKCLLKSLRIFKSPFFRRSRLEVFCQNGIHKNFGIFTGSICVEVSL